VQPAFFLPANKHPTSYQDVFRQMVSEATKLGVKGFSAIVYADFETAIHSAVTTVWPDLKVKACHFHLGQSWWRKIQSLELNKHYGKEESEVSQFLKKIYSDCRTALRWNFYPIFRTTSERNSFATTC
jgi:hypothetical protein